MSTCCHEAPLNASQAEDALGFTVTMAFQPMVDVDTQTIWAYEALVRGSSGESAPEVLSRVHDANQYAFDQLCRVRAIELAAAMGLPATETRLSLNFLPGAVFDPRASLTHTLEAARRCGFTSGSILFEITEGKRIDLEHMRRIATQYQAHGFGVALDDFGAGFSGLQLLNVLDDIQLLKLDGTLIRHIDKNLRSRRMVRSLLELCGQLGVEVLAECVETEGEYAALRDMGVSLMQGFLFARPAFEAFPQVNWPHRRPFAPPAKVVPKARELLFA